MSRAAAGLLLLNILILSATANEVVSSPALNCTDWGESSRTVAVVNCVPYHLEVLLGVVATLKSLQYNVIAYGYALPNEPGDRFKSAFAALHAALGDIPFYDCSALRQPTHAHFPIRAAVFVSGLEDWKFSQDIYHHLRAKLPHYRLLTILHNSDSRTFTRGIVNSHPSVGLLALAEGTYEKLTDLLHPMPGNVQMGWVLPTFAMGQGATCVERAEPCHAHFTVQGNLASARRDYTGLMREMVPLKGQLQAAGVLLKLVGGGDHDPSIPPELGAMVSVHRNLGFSEFYSVVEASVALVPALASATYLDGTKITSTLITSLILGVPVLADQQFAEAYDFLPPSCFYMQLPGETTAAAMLRVAGLSVLEHQLVRRSLAQVRQQLLRRNMHTLEQLLDHQCAHAALPALPAAAATTAATVSDLASAAAAAAAGPHEQEQQQPQQQQEGAIPGVVDHDHGLHDAAGLTSKVHDVHAAAAAAAVGGGAGSPVGAQVVQVASGAGGAAAGKVLHTVGGHVVHTDSAAAAGTPASAAAATPAAAAATGTTAATAAAVTPAAAGAVGDGPGGHGRGGGVAAAAVQRRKRQH